MPRRIASRITRRTFVASIAAAGLTPPLLSPRLVRAVSPNSVVRHACVGVSGMGWSDLTNLRRHPNVRIVALCDVNRDNFAKPAAASPDARHFADYRKLFDDFAGGFDSINVTIPDHMHAPVAMRALEAGKHLYCQKPMTKWLGELHDLATRAAAARSAGVVTQLGVQNHARTEFRLARWAIREGLIGRVTHVHAWSNKTWGGAVPTPKPAAVPDSLDWNLWLGVAPQRAFSPDAYQPGVWRNWVDFGSGLLGDMAAHVFDSPMHALDLAPPTLIRSTGPAPTEQNWPDRATVEYTFPRAADAPAHPSAPADGNPVTLTWYDGATKPPDDIAARFDHRLPQTGSMLIGEAGAMLIPHVAAPRLLPADKFADARFPKLDRVDHYDGFIDAILGGAPTEAPLDGYGRTLVTAVLLGNVAQRRPDATLRWDRAAARFVDDAGANDLLSRPYRTGW